MEASNIDTTNELKGEQLRNLLFTAEQLESSGQYHKSQVRIFRGSRNLYFQPSLKLTFRDISQRAWLELSLFLAVECEADKINLFHTQRLRQQCLLALVRLQAKPEVVQTRSA
jgi:hypothetical protein